MRKFLILSAVLASIAAVPLRTTAQSGLTDGQVTKIDTKQNKITLRHGPMKKFDMDDGMTMVFRVQDPGMLKRVKVGDRVKFDAERINGQFTVTKIEKAK